MIVKIFPFFQKYSILIETVFIKEYKLDYTMLRSSVLVMILNISFLLFLVYGGAGVTGQNFEPGITFKKKNSSLSQSQDFLSQLSNNSKNVTLTGRYELSNGYCYSVFVKDNIVYFGDGNYLKIVDVSDPANPVELSRFALSSPNISGICVSGNYAYVANHIGGFRIIDVSDPAAPKEVWHTACNAMGVVVSGNYAYVTDYYDGLKIIDISNISAPDEVGIYSARESAMGISVSGDFAYAAYCFYGLVIIDVSVPTAPAEAGLCDTGGSAMGVFVSGNYAYVADRDTGLRIIDVSDPSYPEEMGFYKTRGTAKQVSVSGNHAYVAAGESGLQIIDISDLSGMKEAGYYETGGFVQEAFFYDKYIYLADWTEGIFILQYEENVGVEDEERETTGIADRFRLLQNYPNPFNPATTIEYRLINSNDVTLSVHNITGQTVRILVNETQPPGEHSVTWDGRNRNGIQVPCGIYLCRLKAGDYIQTRKMVFVK